MCGARPACLSAGFVLEEGLDTALLGRIVASMRDAARSAGVRIVRSQLGDRAGVYGGLAAAVRGGVMQSTDRRR